MQSPTPSAAESTGPLRPLAADATLPGAAVPAAPRSGRPEWVDEARAAIAAPGRYLAYEDSGRQRVIEVGREWTRIGRSLSAELRFDDATVSRRHALVVVQADGVRVLDDRSLNGVYVNGSRVEWSPLADGDEIAIGRHRLWFLELAAVGAPPPAPAVAAP